MHDGLDTKVTKPLFVKGSSMSRIERNTFTSAINLLMSKISHFTYGCLFYDVLAIH